MAKSRLVLIACILLLTTGVVVAQENEQNEEEQIQRRQEWFHASRTAPEGERIDLLRSKAVTETQERIRSLRTPDTSSWVSVGPSPSNYSSAPWGPVSGRITAIAKDTTNNILYVGAASGGFWKSTNDGASWTSLFDSVGTQTIGAIAVDPNNPQTLWAGTGESTMPCETYFGTGLWRSTDGGSTWQQRNGTGADTLQNLANFSSVVVDPDDSNHLLVGGFLRDCGTSNTTFQTGGLYSTTDGGATWTTKLSTGGVTEIVRASSSVYWAATMIFGLYKSTDGGNTWNVQTASGLPSGIVGRTEVAVAPSNSNYVYALFQTYSSPQLWRTTDAGTSWTLMASGANACDGQCSYNMVLRVHNTDPNTIFRGTILIYKSADGGANWTNLSGEYFSAQVHVDTQAFFMDPANANTFYVGSDGGIWKTTDGGTTFSNRNGNLNITQFYAVGNHPTDNNLLVGGAQDNSSLARVSSNVWEEQTQTGDGFIGLFNPVNPQIVYAASYPSYGTHPNVMRSTTGVLGPYEWITINKINSPSNWMTPYMMDPSNPSTLYLATRTVFKSTDDGSNWGQVGPSGMTTDTLSALEVNRSDGNYVFTGSTDGNIWRSTDAGGNWTDITSGLPGRYVNDIAGDRSNPLRAFAAVGGFLSAHLWEHTGSGDWIQRGNGLPDVPANTVFMRTSTEIYVGTDVGVFVSTDGGINFVPFMTGLPQGVVVTDLKYNANTQTLIAGTYGRGAWMYQFPVPGCGGSDRSLSIGTQRNDSLNCTSPEVAWRYYSLSLPAGRQYLLRADLSNLTGDADVYLRYGSKPNLTSYDCRPYARGTAAETCVIPTDKTGTVWIGVNNFDAGTINYSLLVSWAEGTLQGTVTNSSGTPIAGATISVDSKQATTNASGFYQMILSPGSKTVTAYAYSYHPATANGVAVTANATSTQNFTLSASTGVTISGTVKDGSGQGWPLYAKITIDGYPGGPVYTNPATGAYSVNLYADNQFTLHVSAVLPGYNSQSRTIHPTGSGTENFALTVEPSCTAPGYSIQVAPLVNENFDAGLPSGWSAIDNANDVIWRFDNPCNRTNNTGGANGFAIADSDCLGADGGVEDTELRTPVYDVTGHNTVVLQFNSDFYWYDVGLGAIGDFDISPDNGATWYNLVRYEGASVRGPHLESYDLSDTAILFTPALFSFRFHYYNANYDWFWQVDNFQIIADQCLPRGGGLLVGSVADPTGTPLNNATVTADAVPADATSTFATPEDPNLPDGFYSLWSSQTGARSFTASKANAGSSTHVPNIVAGSTVTQNFILNSARIVPSTLLIEKTVIAGDTTPINVPVTLTNTGTQAVDFSVYEHSGTAASQLPFASNASAPLRRVAGPYGPATTLLKQAAHLASTVQRRQPAAAGKAPNSPPWITIADLPVQSRFNRAVTVNGKVYDFGGMTLFDVLDNASVYDPATDAWSPLSPLPMPRFGMAAAAINEKIYMAGGINANLTLSGELLIYDPATDSYTTGAAIPTSVWGATAVSIKQKLYVIGGCTGPETCNSTGVQVYDSALNSWSSVAAYPEPVAFSSCGAIDGFIYCAGAESVISGTAAQSKHAYVFSPAGNNWSPVADMPQGQTEAVFGVSGGKLYVSGGVLNDFTTITNEGFAYDPAGNSWSPIPNANQATKGAGSACGLFRIGGSTGYGDPTSSAELYPLGTADCDAPDVAWLSETPDTGTINANGGQVVMTVTIDPSVVSSTPGDYKAHLSIAGNMPGAANIDVILHVITPCVFCDDFEDGDLTVPAWTPKKAVWTVSNGDAVSTTSAKTDLESPNFGGCSTCSFGAPMSVSSGGRVSLIGWYSSGSNQVEIRLMQDKQMLLVVQKGAGLSAKGKASIQILPDTFYDVKAVYDGAKFHVFIDGVEKVTLNAVATPSGRAKFRIKSPLGASVTGRYEEIRVQ